MGKEKNSIDGGLGGDLLSGGLGPDVFVETTYHSIGSPEAADARTTSGTTAGGADLIVDFVTGTDKIKSLISSVSSPSAVTDTPGSVTNYHEFSDSSVASVASAIAAYDVGSTPITYTFIAGSSDGFLLIDTDNNQFVDSAIVLIGLNHLSDFAFGDIS